MQRLLTYNRIQTGTCTDTEDSWLLAPFPAYFPKIDPLQFFSVLFLVDTGCDFPQIFSGIPKDSEISGKIVAGSCGNHTKADTVKIRNAIQHFIDSSVSPYHQQIDGSFRNLSTDLSGQLHCMFFITGQICII